MESRIYLVSLGCDKNRVDGEIMIGTLRGAGYNVVNQPANADIIIVNTCGFIREAVSESIDLVLELAAYKKEGDCRGLIVVGCMAERYRKEMSETLPEADAIIGVGEYDNIVSTVDGILGIKATRRENSADPYLTRLAARTDDAVPHVAYVKISEGCDNRCAYCTIPAIRGPYKSRGIESILEECRMLVSAGAKELVFVAQDTALYGKDIFGEPKLPTLLRKVAETSGADWIRLMYAYPEHITDELISAMAELPQVCEYIDMPIQHSEDSILTRMGRAGNKKAIEQTIRKLRENIPDISIRTTLMVGFPGETAEDFRRLFDFAGNVRFDRLGVFPFSREAGTPAATMPQQVREEVKIKRLNRIMGLQQKIHFSKQHGFIGKTIPVIVDTPDESGGYAGRTRYDAYEVDAVVRFTSRSRLSPGQILAVKITDQDGYDLRGEANELAE